MPRSRSCSPLDGDIIAGPACRALAALTNCLVSSSESPRHPARPADQCPNLGMCGRPGRRRSGGQPRPGSQYSISATSSAFRASDCRC